MLIRMAFSPQQDENFLPLIEESRAATWAIGSATEFFDGSVEYGLIVSNLSCPFASVVSLNRASIAIDCQGNCRSWFETEDGEDLTPIIDSWEILEDFPTIKRQQVPGQNKSTTNG